MKYVRIMKKIKVFTVNRQEDINETSGTGYVITGFIMDTGKTIIIWNTPTPSITIFDSYQDFLKIHDHPENESIIQEMSINIDSNGSLSLNINGK